MERPNADRAQRLPELGRRRQTAGDAATPDRTGVRHAVDRKATALLLRSRAARSAQRSEGGTAGEGRVERPDAGRPPGLRRLDQRWESTRGAETSNRKGVRDTRGREAAAADGTVGIARSRRRTRCTRSDQAVRGKQCTSSGSGVMSNSRITTSPRAAHRPIEEDHQLLAKRVRVSRAAVRANADEPVAESAFVPARDRSGEHDGLAPFADCIRKRATAKLFRSKPCFE